MVFCFLLIGWLVGCLPCCCCHFPNVSNFMRFQMSSVDWEWDSSVHKCLVSRSAFSRLLSSQGAILCSTNVGNRFLRIPECLTRLQQFYYFFLKEDHWHNTLISPSFSSCLLIYYMMCQLLDLRVILFPEGSLLSCILFIRKQRMSKVPVTWVFQKFTLTAGQL